MNDGKITIIVHQHRERFLSYIENVNGEKILLDDMAHSNIKSNAEAKARANALRVALAASVVMDLL